MIKKNIYLILFIAILLIIIGIYYINNISTQLDTLDLKLANPSDFNEFEYNKSLLEASFEKNFIKDSLPITNLIILDDDQLASGDDILSESLGLMMQLAIKNDDQDLFEIYVELMDDKFIKPNGLLKWRISNNAISDDPFIVNASVDDLRIAKALIEAYDKWNDSEYLEKGKKIGKSLYKYCVSNDILLSYDSESSPKAILTYYDFKALLLLSNYQKEWKPVLANGIDLVLTSQVGHLPLYQKDEDGYKSIENLIVLMHLYEVGYEQPESLNFIKNNIKQSGYFDKYDYKGNPIGVIESPAVYGIISQIAKLANDEVLYKMSCEKITYLQNPDTSKYYGGFVNEDTLEGYSFDHLMALLGF